MKCPFHHQLNVIENQIPARPGTSLLEMKKQLTPEQYSQFLRDKGDLFFWEMGNFWVITDFELAQKALRNPALSADRSSFFISRMPNLNLGLVKDFFHVVGQMMVMSDGPTHLKRRKVAAQGLDEDLLELFRPKIEMTIARLIATAAAKGEIEFVKDIAEPLPSIVLADLFGIQEHERKDFYIWSNQMTQFFGGASQYRNEDGIEVNKSAVALHSYFAEKLKHRRLEPSDDFISVLLANQARLELSDDEVIAQAIMMLVAGQITTTDQFNNNMYSLLTIEGVHAKLKANVELLPTALEEMNRLDPGVSYLFRVAKQATTIGSQEIREGQTVFISNHAVNRDPKVFSSPNTAQLDRNPNPHMAYGHGGHYCLGARLARIQMNACFREILTRFPDLKLIGTGSRRKHHSLAFSGFEELRLAIK